MATLKFKKNAESRYPQFPKLKDFFTKFISSLTGADPNERMIYGIKRDAIERNNSREVDVTGNCLLETLFYLTDPNRCDGLSEEDCKTEKDTFSKEKRKELVEKFNEVNKDPEKDTIDTFSLKKIVKSSTYLGPESLKLFALMFNCNFLIFVVLPGDIAVNYYCNTNPSRGNTYVLLLKGATGQHFIPLIRKMDPSPSVLKALTRVSFTLFEGQDQIRDDYRLKANMGVFKRGELEDTSRILELTCGLDELTSKLNKYMPKSGVEPDTKKAQRAQSANLQVSSIVEPPLLVEPPLPEPSLPQPPLPPSLSKKSSSKSAAKTKKKVVDAPKVEPQKVEPPKPPSPKKIPQSNSKNKQKNQIEPANLNRPSLGVYLPNSKLNDNSNSNNFELRWKLQGKGQTRKEFRNRK
uniref:Uncharacterized protein n=1 Tax=viral metagenome TaxID=1070528 RepID=A0A6C0JMW8_9ZZZZ